MAALARELPLLPLVARVDSLRPEELAAAARELAAQMEAYTRGGEMGPTQRAGEIGSSGGIPVYGTLPPGLDQKHCWKWRACAQFCTRPLVHTEVTLEQSAHYGPCLL